MPNWNQIGSPVALPKVYIDGRLVDAGSAGVSVFDHGLLYGDGVFEGIRVYDGRPFALEEHLERLTGSAKSISLTLPLERDGLRDVVRKMCRVNDITKWIRASRSHPGERRPGGRSDKMRARDAYLHRR